MARVNQSIVWFVRRQPWNQICLVLSLPSRFKHSIRGSKRKDETVVRNYIPVPNTITLLKPGKVRKAFIKQVSAVRRHSTWIAQ
jgi:hypothetical protein